jgi:hypothetical protein
MGHFFGQKKSYLVVEIVIQPIIKIKKCLQVYTTTTMKTILIDERFANKPVNEWHHSNCSTTSKVPAGLTSYLDPNTNLEYVITYWSDGDVNLLCTDWQHSICSDRLFSDTNIKLSCQKQNKKSCDIIYPLTRGKPVCLPSTKSLLNSIPFDKDSTRDRINVPWTGMSILASAEEDQRLKIMAVNAIGDIFLSVLEHKETFEQTVVKMARDITTDATSYDHDVTNADLSDLDDMIDPFSQLSQSPIKETTANQSTALNRSDLNVTQELVSAPMDHHKLEAFLLPRKLTKSDKTYLKTWETNLPSYDKVWFASSIFIRDGLPKQDIETKNKRTIKRVCRKPVPKKRITRARAGRPRKTIVEPVPPEFKLCPSLTTVNFEDYIDKAGQNIGRIFAGLTIFPNLELTDNESDVGFKSEKLRRREKSRREKDSLTPGLPEDAGYTLDQFLHGLEESGVTSTQQSQPVSSQMTQMTSESHAMSSTMMEYNNTHYTIDESTYNDSQSMHSRSLGGGGEKKRKKKKKKHLKGF